MKILTRIICMEFIPDSRVNYLRNEADLEELNDYENIMCSIEEIFRTL